MEGEEIGLVDLINNRQGIEDAAGALGVGVAVGGKDIGDDCEDAEDAGEENEGDDCYFEVGKEEGKTWT